MPTDDETFAQQRQMAVTRMLRPRAFSHTTYVDGAYGSFDPGEEGGGGSSAPAWVPENAKIHIDLVGGTPQGRAWVDGVGEVAVDTLLGSDPNTESGWDITAYDPAFLFADGYIKPGEGGVPVALIDDARTAFFAGVTMRVQWKIVTGAGTLQMNVVAISADGDDAVDFSLEDALFNLDVESWGGPFNERLLDVVNTGVGDVNILALTLMDMRIEFAINGSAAFAGTLSETDRPPGNPLVAALVDMAHDRIALQSITLYDPLPSTAGLSELSEP